MSVWQVRNTDRTAETQGLSSFVPLGSQPTDITTLQHMSEGMYRAELSGSEHKN